MDSPPKSQHENLNQGLLSNSIAKPALQSTAQTLLIAVTALRTQPPASLALSFTAMNKEINYYNNQRPQLGFKNAPAQISEAS